MKIILTPDDTPQHSIEACERLPLEDFGTTTLWREFNTGTSLERTSPEFIDAVTYVMALALTSVRTLVRVRHGDDHHVALDISRWQIYDVGRVIFATVEYKNSVIEKIVDKTAENALMKEVAVPMALKVFFEEQLQRAGVGPERLLPVQLRLMRLAILVISLSAVRGISACREMPIVADIGPLQTVGFTERVTSTQDRGPHLVQSTDLFFSVAQVLLGGYRLNTEELARKPNVFMMSEFGWTLYLSSVAATDPTDAIPDQLFLKRGVPTNESTQERKLWVRDMTDIGGDGMIPARKITDRGQVCEPRCVEQVVNRVEYYSTSKDEFRLSIRHCMELHTSSMANVDCRYDIYRSYRAFHDGLWESTLVPSCEHDQVRVQTDFIELLPDMAAGTALDWSNEGQEGDIEEDERLCVALVKGNPHSRWLAVAEAGFDMPRNVALRGPTTCATCALKWAAKRAGKWLIIV
ncbi:hypothetical protein LA080_012296 [Diaporthe eres]|nr:hypothetical protein LA080_012296 [Diaporthe eres]